MPTWGEILKELSASAAAGRPDFDGVRRKYLVELHRYTGRAVILYSTSFVDPKQATPDLISITDEDLQGLMEVVHGIDCERLDLILHSPGGSIEAAEALVKYLRSKFSDIRVIVPSLAMSAATMMACAANRIVMGKHSFLGPVDPQFVFATAMGQRMVSAQAIQEQFVKAQRDCVDPTKLGSWIPMLAQYGPDILVKCENAGDLSKSLVKEWLSLYMFAADADKEEKASAIADWLATHNNFKTHSRHLGRDQLIEKKLVIDCLEDDDQLQDLVLSVFHATNHAFVGTPAVKIIENHAGHAYIKQITVTPQMQQGMQPRASLLS